jgi:Na+/phosphate symporter
MTNIQKLQNLLLNEFMPLLEDEIDAIFMMIEKEKMISLADREELEELQEMHKECREILIEIESKELDEEEAKELLEELIDIASK